MLMFIIALTLVETRGTSELNNINAPEYVQAAARPDRTREIYSPLPLLMPSNCHSTSPSPTRTPTEGLPLPLS